MNSETVSKLYELFSKTRKTAVDQPKLAGVVSVILVLGLLTGMYQAADQPLQTENNTSDDFDYGELDPQPENETRTSNVTEDNNQTVDNSTSSKNQSIPS